MHPGRLAPHILVSISIAALAVLAGLLLFPDPALAAKPDFGAETATRTLPENSAAGVNVVGGTIIAMDLDTGDTLTYSLTGTDAEFFEIDSNGQIKTTGDDLDFNFEATKNTYEVTVEVTDGNDGMGGVDTTADDTIDVTISLTDANDAPTIDSGEAAITKPENTATSEVLETYMASDVDVTGDMLSWSLTGVDASAFSIITTGGQLGLLGQLSFAQVPDYEMPADTGDAASDNQYKVTIEVTDDGSPAMSTTLDVTVTVTDVNERPEITTTDAAYDFAENTPTATAVATFQAADPDSGDVLTWTLTGDDAGDFSISGQGVLTFKTSPDFEMPAGSGDPADNTYEATVNVRDSKADDGTADTMTDDDLAVVVTVTDVNEPPEISTTDKAYNFAENTLATTAVATFAATDPDAGAMLTWTLTGDDADDFNISTDTDQNGVLTFKASPDFESPAGSGDPADNTYEITVQVTDDEDEDGNSDPAVDDDLEDVVVTVTNVDEPGVVSISGMLEGGEELTASVTDPDGTVSSLSWQWSTGDTADGTFTNISGATSAMYTSIAVDVGKFLRATATYKDPESATENKIAHGTTSSAIAASNDEPEFGDTTATRTLPENSGAGVDVVGGTITATDGDMDTLVYLLTGTDAGLFQIDANGQIKTKTGVQHDFNFEATKNSYTVTVEVRDNKDAANNADTAVDDTIAVTINLTNVNEAPTIDSGPADGATINVNENAATAMVVAPYTASDVDAMTMLTEILTGDDAEAFTFIWSLDNTRYELKFKNSPNYEMPADTGDMNNQYEVTIGFSDGSLDVTRDLTVAVVDVNEAPVISGNGSPSFTEIEFDVDGSSLTISDLTVPGTYTFTDEDGDGVAWTLTGDDASHFRITRNTDGSSFVAFRNPTPEHHR